MEKNPFCVEEVPSPEEWLTLQTSLRAIDLTAILEPLYPQNLGYATFADFLRRCSQGIRQTFIDPARGLFPQKSLERIGKGSDLCIVSYASYDGLYPEFVQANSLSLESVGFHGYYLYAIGEFPKSQGGTLAFAGVPYSFKMGMMLEAQRMGFSKALWIDSAMMPLKDPTPLFDRIEETGALFLDEPPFSTLWRYIFPSTLELLRNLTGTDVLQARHIWGAVFGLKLDTPTADAFFAEYDRFVQLGWPFLSCYPEQFVLSAILGQEHYAAWLENPVPQVLSLDFSETRDPREEMDSLKQMGYYFYLRRH